MQRIEIKRKKTRIYNYENKRKCTALLNDRPLCISLKMEPQNTPNHNGGLF